MWTKIAVSVASNKKIRTVAIVFFAFSLFLMVITPIIGVAVLLSPVLLIIGFFTSIFGSGVKAPIHPLQNIGHSIGCEMNIFDLNTIDIIENELFPYTYSAEEMTNKSKNEKNGVPYYSGEHLNKIKNRYKNYYFDSVTIQFYEKKEPTNFCSLRYLSDVFDDIQKDNPDISNKKIENTVSQLKKIVNAYTHPPFDYSLMRENGYGNSGIFANYLYKPSKRTTTKSKGEMYQFIDPVPTNAHRGLDFPLPIGNAIFSVSDGIVISTDDGWKDGDLQDNGSGTMGNNVRIESRFPSDENENSSARMVYGYLHLTPNSITVKKNDVVSKGDLIGYSGNSGFSTGAHLDFRIQLKSFELDLSNDYMNPYSILLHDLYVNKRYIDVEKPTLGER